MKLRIALCAAVLTLATPALGSAPQVGGRAYLVKNATTGEVLLARNADERVPMASITKLMTVLVTLDRVDLDDVVTVSRGAAAVGESSIYLRPGEQLTVRELLEAALIQSANDAAAALADYVGHGHRARFVALMNAKAKELGLTHTHFANPDGLDERGHYSSARDLTRLAQAAMASPVVRKIVRTREKAISGGRRLETWNDLLYTFPHLIGVKTGHTSGAGWSEVAAARGQGGLVVYATLLGEPTRDQRNDDLARLLAWGLSRYRVLPLIEQKTYATAALPYGKGRLGIVARRPVSRVVRLGRPLVVRVVVPRVVSLPVARGQRLGAVRVYRRGRLIASSPLVASEGIAKPGFLGRAGWYAGETVDTVWGWVT